MKPSIRSLTWTICLFALLGRLQGLSAETLVLPPGFANSPGDGSDSWPTETGRLQNVFSARFLQDAMPDGGYITQVGFRLDESTTRAFSGNIRSVEIKMAVSSSLEPVISLDFAANIGSRYTTVFGPRSLSYNVAAGSVGTKPFSIFFPLETPFLYHPSQGGLVVDYFYHQGATTGISLDRGSGAFALIGGLNENRASDFWGAYVTELRYDVIPEPRASILILIGIAITLNVARRK